MAEKNKKYNDIEVRSVEVSSETTIDTVIEKKSLEKVILVQPQKVKRGLISRLFSGVVGPDGASGIGEYVNEEIVKPAIKNIIVDAVTSGINMIMYGERGGVKPRGYNREPRSQYSRQTQQSHYQQTNYRSQYTPATPEPIREVRNTYGVEEYKIDSRNDAAHVLITLTENAEVYGSVSIADYYDLIGVSSVYTDNQYGWTADTISRATIISVRGGFLIKFPRVEVI